MVHANYSYVLPCIETWEFFPLPKRVAEKLSTFSVRMRLFAAVAWDVSSWKNRPDPNDFPVEGGYDMEAYEAAKRIWTSPNQHVSRFWEHLAELQKSTLGELLDILWEIDVERIWSKHHVSELLEAYLNLPSKSIDWEVRFPTYDQCVEAIVKNSDAYSTCVHIFGVGGKATVKAFKSCINPNAWRWAVYLVNGNPDLLQKYFRLEDCLEFEPLAVDLLQHLGEAPAFRLVSTTKAVDRSVLQTIGELWYKIHSKPQLGRVRSWDDAYRLLKSHLLAGQPDSPLTMYSSWVPVDGLCSVDRSWEIELPRSTANLRLWGEQLDHCVADYCSQVYRGECVIFAVKQNGQVMYTVEMIPKSRRWKCNQFLGRRNSQAPFRLKQRVFSALKQAGLLID